MFRRVVGYSSLERAARPIPRRPVMTAPEHPPTYRTGKICYIEIPATDIQQSAEFYGRAFGWQIRRRGAGAPHFADTGTQGSGPWVCGRPPAAEPELAASSKVPDRR